MSSEFSSLHVAVTTVNGNKTITYSLFIVTEQHNYNPCNDTVKNVLMPAT